MAKFVINIAEIGEPEGKTYALDVTREWLAAALADTDYQASDKSGTLKLEVRKTCDDLLVSGHIETKIVVPCSRCNEAMSWAVSVDFTHLLSPLGSRGEVPEELELTPEDLVRDYYGSDLVELDTVVREQVLLSVPMQPTHDDDGCNPDVMKHLQAASEAKPMSPLAALAKLKDDL